MPQWEQISLVGDVKAGFTETFAANLPGGGCMVRVAWRKAFRGIPQSSESMAVVPWCRVENGQLVHDPAVE